MDRPVRGGASLRLPGWLVAGWTRMRRLVRRMTGGLVRTMMPLPARSAVPSPVAHHDAPRPTGMAGEPPSSAKITDGQATLPPSRQEVRQRLAVALAEIEASRAPRPKGAPRTGP